MRLPDPQRSRVVLIGTSRYEDEKLLDLPAVGRGIKDLKGVLTNAVYGLVPETHCDVLENVGDIPLIGRRLRRAASQAEDLLLVYFAGHGLTAGRRHELCLAMRDTEWEAPQYAALEYDDLRSEVLSSPATTKMIILDCCFSGRVLGETMADPASALIGQVEVDGSYVLVSAHRNAVALILEGEDYTAFTGRLLRLLHDGVPDGPELLTIDNIYHRLRAQMKAEGLPQPHSRGTDNANLLALTRNRAYAMAQAVKSAILQPLPVSIRPSSQGVAQPGSVTEPIGIINDRYELYGPCTRGSLADAYMARDLLLGRAVTVKVLRHNSANDEGFFAYFNDEARAAAGLSDPGISSIYDFGKAEINGLMAAYIVMEYAEGQTLAEILRERGRLPPGEAVAVVDNFLYTLDVIHRNSLLYQDMGPGDIILTRTGGVKISNTINLGFILTVRGNYSIGTMSSYMAPEKISGRPDVRSDVYCTGCLLYELLTGQPPFGNDSRHSRLYQTMYDDPPAPSTISQKIPLWCDRIALKALSRDPELRYQSPSDMRKDIHAAMSLHRPYE